MSFSRSHQRQISVRQRREDDIERYEAFVRSNRMVDFHGKWEANSQKKLDSSCFRQEVKRLDCSRASLLSERRLRLKALLQEEQTVYEAELLNFQKSEVDRRDHIASRALELRLHRDRLRSEEAQELTKNKFQEECAVLRDARSKIALMKCVEDRSMQIAETQVKRTFEREVNSHFHSMVEKKCKEAQLKEISEIEERKAANLKLMGDLEKQCQEHKMRLRQKREEELEESRTIVRNIVQESEREKQLEIERKLLQKELLNKNVMYNEELKRIKMEEDQKDREAGTQEVARLRLEFEQQEIEERKNKELCQKEAIRLRGEQRKAMMKQAEDQSAIEALWKDENERQWHRKEARQKIDQEAREKQAQEAYKGRIEQIRAKREKEKIEAEMKKIESESLIEKSKAELKSQAIADVLSKHKNKMNQIELLEQVKERSLVNGQLRTRMNEEIAAAYIAEREVEVKILKEIQELEREKPNRFRHIPLIK